MEFSITKSVVSVDDQNNITESTVTETYKAELSSDGDLNIYAISEDGEEIHIIHQPWNFTDDGKKIGWNTLEEGINWFKSETGYSGDQNG